MERTALICESWVDWDPDWLAPEEADALLAALTERSWEQRAIHAGGKDVMQPRLMDWAGELPYRYSGLTLEPRPLDPILADLLARTSAACGVDFNHVVLNLYRDGKDRVGPHADDEVELGREPIIASVSLGAPRKFIYHLKNRRRSRRRYSRRLTHGSLFVMGGGFQHAWYHAVPGDDHIKEPRINLTFRKLLEPPRPRRTDGDRGSAPGVRQRELQHELGAALRPPDEDD